MKNTATLFLLLGLGLAGCAEYRPSEANCFDTATRNAGVMTFMPTSEPAPRVRVSTKSAPCSFISLSGPEGLGDG